MTQSERRDMFAAAALTGLLANPQSLVTGSSGIAIMKNFADDAFALADAMIAASKEKDGD